jgi:hypothetical protein
MDEQASFDYEHSDIDTVGIAWIAAGLGLFVLVVPLLMPLVYPRSMQHITPAAPPALSADAPQLEVVPSADLKRLDAANERIADSYGWTDKEHGAVRIPVSRAIELLLQKGMPGWPSP